MNNFPLNIDIYINYPGTCKEAFRFYEEHLGGKIVMMVPHPQAGLNFPKEWKNPILHAIIEISGMLVRGGNPACQTRAQCFFAA